MKYADRGYSPRGAPAAKQSGLPAPTGLLRSFSQRWPFAVACNMPFGLPDLERSGLTPGAPEGRASVLDQALFDAAATFALALFAYGCLAITVAGFGNADRVAEAKDHGLALLRIYGAHGLTAVNLASNGAATNVDLTGILDPRNQDGASAVSSIKAATLRVICVRK
jgi:hypothetical protein